MGGMVREKLALAMCTAASDGVVGVKHAAPVVPNKAAGVRTKPPPLPLFAGHEDFSAYGTDRFLNKRNDAHSAAKGLDRVFRN